VNDTNTPEIAPGDAHDIAVELLTAAIEVGEHMGEYQAAATIAAIRPDLPAWHIAATAGKLVWKLAARHGNPPYDRTEDEAQAETILVDARASIGHGIFERTTPHTAANVMVEVVRLARAGGDEHDQQRVDMAIAWSNRNCVFDVWGVGYSAAHLMRFLASMGCNAEAVLRQFLNEVRQERTVIQCQTTK